jgi:hypothetical protein
MTGVDADVDEPVELVDCSPLWHTIRLRHASIYCSLRADISSWLRDRSATPGAGRVNL